MTRKIQVGRIENTVGFSIDKRSWNNLNKFQKRLAQLKKQMKGLSGGISIKASAVIKSQNQVKQIIQRTSDFKQKIENKASKTLFADRLRGEEKAAKKSAKIEQAIRSRKADVSIAGTGFTRLKPAQLGQMRSQFESLNSSLRRGSISMADYRKQTQQLMVTFRRANRSVQTLNEKFLSLRHNMLGIGIAGGAIAGGVGITKTGQDFESMGAKMLIATGGAEEAAKAMEMARFQSKRLGLDLLQTSDSMARLGIAARDKLSESEFKSLFISFSELGTAAQLPKEQMDRGLRALEQMLNKGQLMAEEVKGQFAEAIPGGIRIFADALGVGEQEFFKMMESGQLLSADVLPKVAEQMAMVARRGGALGVAMTSNRAAMNRMITSFQEFKRAIFVGGFSSVLTEIFNSLNDLTVAARPLAVVLGQTLSSAISTVTLPLRLLIAGLADLVEFFGVTGDSAITSFVAKLVGIGLGIAGLVFSARLLRTVFKGLMAPLGWITGLLGGKAGTGTAAGKAMDMMTTKVGKLSKAMAILQLISKGGIIGLGLAGIAIAGFGIHTAFKNSKERNTPEVVARRKEQIQRSSFGRVRSGSVDRPVKVEVSVDDEGAIKTYVQRSQGRFKTSLIEEIQANTGK